VVPSDVFKSLDYATTNPQLLDVLVPVEDVLINYRSSSIGKSMFEVSQASKKVNVDPFDDFIFDELFENELPKYLECLGSIHGRLPLFVINMNTTSGHVLTNL
jgi:hypothetical protein